MKLEYGSGMVKVENCFGLAIIHRKMKIVALETEKREMEAIEQQRKRDKLEEKKKKERRK